MTQARQPIARRTLAATAGLLIALGALGSGCAIDEFEEDFDTEFTVPKPESQLNWEPFSKAKRFTLKKDPADADSVRFLDAGLSVIAPAGSDLTFMNRLEVYVCDSVEFADCRNAPDNPNLTLLAEAEGFRPNETSRGLDIVYTGDIRGFVQDKKVVLTWLVYPTGWGYDWPEEGVTMQTDVVLLINADVL